MTDGCDGELEGDSPPGPPEPSSGVIAWPISPSLVVTQLVTTLSSDWSWCPPVTPEQPSLQRECEIWNVDVLLRENRFVLM